MTAGPSLLTPHLITPNTGAGVVRFGSLRLWSERGLIHCEDGQGGYHTIAIPDFFARVSALNDMVRNSLQQGQGKIYYDALAAHQRFVQAGLELIRRAREQGSPDDPTSRRDLVRRRKRMFVMPAKTSYQEEL